MSGTRTALHGLLARNRDHAASYSGGRPALEPTLRAVLLGCADHRADPAHVFALAPNEALVVRNPGGRVTQSFIQNLAVLATVAAIEGLDPGFELIVMHHTDCGLARLGQPHHANLVATMFGDAGNAPHTVTDPDDTLTEDIETLRRNPFIPGTLVVSGLVYDVDTGLARPVIEPAPLSAGVTP
jgi:carbonic anhydrase